MVIDRFWFFKDEFHSFKCSETTIFLTVSNKYIATKKDFA